MIHDILSKLPGLKSDQVDDADVVLSEEDLKAERIAFHRQKVRNGPVKFSAPSTGQLRRERHRALNRQTKNARRRQIQAHFANKRETAVLRAHLQAAGIVLYANPDFRPAPGDVIAAFTWIISHFADEKATDSTGRIVVTRDVVIQSLQAALNRFQHLRGEPAQTLSPAYVLPVEVAA